MNLYRKNINWMLIFCSRPLFNWLSLACTLSSDWFYWCSTTYFTKSCLWLCLLDFYGDVTEKQSSVCLFAFFIAGVYLRRTCSGGSILPLTWSLMNANNADMENLAFMTSLQQLHRQRSRRKFRPLHIYLIGPNETHDYTTSCILTCDWKHVITLASVVTLV